MHECENLNWNDSDERVVRGLDFALNFVKDIRLKRQSSKNTSGTDVELRWKDNAIRTGWVDFSKMVIGSLKVSLLFKVSAK